MYEEWKRQRKVFQRKNPEWISLKSRETEFTAKKMQSKSIERKMWTRALKFQNLGAFCYFCRPCILFAQVFLVFSTVLVWVRTAEMQPLFCLHSVRVKILLQVMTFVLGSFYHHSNFIWFQWGFFRGNRFHLLHLLFI